MGYKGGLAQTCALLIHQLWKPHNSNIQAGGAKQQHQKQQDQPIPLNVPSITPKSFKDAISKLSDHFAGNEQHDAQELLSFLLSGLSEDLNRIHDRIYIEQPDSDGTTPNTELADIWWKNHLRREMSIIVALFTGQYKSLLSCKECKYESARFEPFAFLQLPLPEDDLFTVMVIYIPLDFRRRVCKYSVKVSCHMDGGSTVFDCLKALAKIVFGSEKKDDDTTNKKENDEKRLSEEGEENEKEDYVARAQNMAVVDIRESRILSIIPTNRSISQIQSRDTNDVPLLYVYELDPLPPENNTIKCTKHDAATPIKEVDGSSNISIPNGTISSTSDDDDEENTESLPQPPQKEESVESENDVDDVKSNEHHSNKGSTTNSIEQQQSSSSMDIPITNPEIASSSMNNSNSNNTTANSATTLPSSILPQSRPSYIAVAQRKLESLLPSSPPQNININNESNNKPYLFPYTMRTFGSPLLLRIVDLEGYTGRDIYDLMAKRICRFVSSQASHTPYYDHLEKVESEVEEGGLYCTNEGEEKLTENDDSNITTTTRRPIFNRRGGVIPQHKPTTISDIHPNPNPNPNSKKAQQQQHKRPKTTIDMKNVTAGPFPRYGFRLRLATRDGKRCSICPWYECCIGCLIPDDDYPTIVQDGDTVALDWHVNILFQNKSCDLLVHSIKALYDTTQSSLLTTKSCPFDNVLKHDSCKDNNGYGNSITLEECLDAFAKEEKIPEAYCSKCKDFRVSTKRMSIWRLPPVMIIHLKRFQFTQHMKRKLRNLVVFPTEGLDLSRIVAEESLDSTTTVTPQQQQVNNNTAEENSSSSSPSKMKESASISSLHDLSSESLYDLYAVVHHQGALSGGHYVASLRSEIDGQWRLFNDAQVYDISSREIVDATAYILFYIRRDVKHVKLTDFWDTSCMTSERDGVGVTEEQIDKLVKHRERCVLS